MAMSSAHFDVTYAEDRNRVTVLFRYFLMIPHSIVGGVWGFAAEVATVIHWFIQVFTGKRNDSISQFVKNYAHYSARVNAYAGLLYDAYPNFGADRRDEPTLYELEVGTDVNRVSVLLRIIFAIPAIIVTYVVMLVAMLATVVSWFVILFTGTHPRGLFDFMLQAHQRVARLMAYLLLLTDDNPLSA